MTYRRCFRICRMVFNLAGALCVVYAARADTERRVARVAPLPKYQQECAVCHVAYPPDMLPAASWQRIMNNLPHHYGTDASLDAATAQQLAAWLTAHASTRTLAEPPEDRITRSSWFTQEHHEVPRSTWKLPAVKSASNCVACHTRADQGDFNEDFVRIPH